MDEDREDTGNVKPIPDAGYKMQDKITIVELPLSPGRKSDILYPVSCIN